MGDTIQGIPSSLPANRPRQASSLSGINELGGYNFKDLEVLVFTALHVAKTLILILTRYTSQ